MILYPVIDRILRALFVVQTVVRNGLEKKAWFKDTSGF